MRGGCSTRASRVSRLQTLTPPAADASRIPCPLAISGTTPGSATVSMSGHASTPTQVSVRAATHLRSWSNEIAAIPHRSLSALVATSDDQRRSSRIRPQVRRWSGIPCNGGSFSHIGQMSNSGVGTTYGGYWRRSCLDAERPSGTDGRTLASRSATQPPRRRSDNAVHRYGGGGVRGAGITRHRGASPRAGLRQVHASVRSAGHRRACRRGCRPGTFSAFPPARPIAWRPCDTV